MSVAARKRVRKPRAEGPSLWSGAGSGGSGFGLAPAAAAAVGGVGLSLTHSVTQSSPSLPVGHYSLRVAEGASVVKITRREGARGSRPDGTLKRGVIQGLSVAAGLRCQRAILSFNQLKITRSFFVTLSLVAGEFQWAHVRRFLKNYRARFERKWPKAAAVWVKELTKKGTPHLHLVVVFTESAPPTRREFIAWNDDAWASVVKSSSPHHRKVSCSVEDTRTIEGAAAYLAGYLSKGSPEHGRQSDCGKMWGFFHRKNLPITWLPEVHMTPAEGVTFQRTMRRWQSRKRTFYLHSMASHDTLRTQGKPVKWRKVRPGQVEVFNGEPVTDLQAYLDRLRCFGLKIKRVRPRCCRRVAIPLWSVDESTQKWESYGEELHAVVSGWHHIAAGEAVRLAEFIKSPPVGRYT